MSRKRQLDALHKVREAEEREALRDRAAAERVYATRRQRLDDLLAQQTALLGKIEEARAGRAESTLSQLQSQEGYVRRLKVDLAAVESELHTAQLDCQRALERVEFHNMEASSARIEKKKMEHLLSTDRRKTLTAGIARLEAEADELVNTSVDESKKD